jgi:excisionase family DNA binding protein
MKAHISIPEVAEYLGIQVRHVHRLRHKDADFPRARKFGRCTRFRVSDIEEYTEKKAS